MRPVFWQYLVPQHLISRITGSLATCKQPFIKNKLISAFIKRYKIDMGIALEPDYTKYSDFNAFFTRAIDLSLRPIASEPNDIASPADGFISQQGKIKEGKIFQAKGCDYSLETLLGGDQKLTETFMNGNFSTVYLSPKDYHRVHMPLSGKLKQMTYVPGKLFSVNQSSVSKIPGLFAKNERLVAVFEGELGSFAVILVGAMIVAGIETVWSGAMAPQKDRGIKTTYYNDSEVALSKGDEMGRFQLGSTVIMLFPKSEMQWESHLTPDTPVILGQKLGEY